MSNIIRIKRSTVNNAPGSLANAELAFSEISDGLFIGKGTGGANGSATTIEAIGGKGYFLSLTGEQTVSGDKTFSGAVDFTGTLEIDSVAVTASAAELNYLAGVTAGQASASKALVVDASKDLDLDGGDLTVQNLTVDGDLTVQGTVTTINSTTVEIADKAIELAVTASPTDTTADQGGIIVKGATDKSFLFDNSSSSFKSSENLNLASGKVVKIDGVEVLSDSALGAGIISSSLEEVGVISAGTWEGDTIAIAHGGTGETSAQAAINALSGVSSASAGHVLTKVGSDAVWAAPADTGISSLNGLTGDTQTFAVGSSGTDFNISSSSTEHTFNIPSASATNRGLVTTGAQTFAGVKTFDSTGTFSVSSTGQDVADFVSTNAAGSSVNITNAGASAIFGLALKSGSAQRASLTHNQGSNWTALAVQSPEGTSVSAIRASSATSTLGRVSVNAASFPAQLFVLNTTTSIPAAIVRGASGQTGNIFEVQNNGQTKLFTVDLFGTVSTKSQAISSTNAANTANVYVNMAAGQAADAIVVRDSALSPLFTVNASGAVSVGSWQGSAVAVSYGGTGATTAAGARTNLDAQQAGANLEAIRGLTSAANKVAYFTGAGTAAVADLTSFGRNLIASATVAEAQAVLDLEPGVDVQPYSARLQSISDLSGSFSAGVVNLVGYSASNTAEFVESSEFGRSVLSAADAAATRTLLDLEPGVDVQAYDAELAALASVTSAADKVPYFTGTGTADVADLSAFGRDLIGAVDAAGVQGLLNLEPGVDVQAYDAELAAIAGLVSASDKGLYFTGSGTASTFDLTSFGRTLSGSASASDARSSLELGSMALQASSSVSISGGSIDGVTLSNVEVDGGSF